MSNIRAKLRKIVNSNTTKRGRIFDYAVQIIIFISLIAYAIETLPDNSSTTQLILRQIQIASVIFFTVEYLLRIFVAKKPLKYIFSFYGVIDLIAILPFYLTSSYGLLSLRVFRIFRIFRAFKLIRYNKALKRFYTAAKLVREEVVLFSIVTGIFLFLASAGIYYFENPVQPKVFSSIFSSGWWAIVTLTTVGYGDIYPITTGGRIFTFFILLLGVGIVTIPAGLVASALSEAREMEGKERREQGTENSKEMTEGKPVNEK
jgi:voltage-gated potassium channel